MSQSSFLRPHRRTKDNAFSSECIIIHIDYYIKPYLKGLSCEKIIDLMETIISKDEKLNRLKIAQKAKRRNADGLTSRQQKVKDNKILIKSLKEQGLSNKEISEEVNLSIRQFQRYLAK